MEKLHEQARSLNLDQSVKFRSLEGKLNEIYQLLHFKSEEARVASLVTRTPMHESMLDPGMEIVRKKLADLDLTGREVLGHQQFMKCLAFTTRVERYGTIPTAHQLTLKWIFSPDNTSELSNKARRLLEWLRTGQGIFWVSGKPGSGKSTLMKFLADSPLTRAALSDWAKDQRVVVASHYFWWSGTALQKSQEGLLRTLLYGIFQECPQLIPTACPERWKGIMENDICGSEQGSKWCLDELRFAFESLANQADLPVKFCIFIDGLDEYGARGELDELCNVLKHLSTSSEHIKFCLSSRPWNEFLVAFRHLGEDQVVHVHELTKNDIRSYAHARLSEHEYWESFSESGDRSGAESLLDLISEQAKGVFLWVFLVTNTLKESLNNHDSFSDLHRRLESYPDNLDDFFKEMLESVDSWYHPKMSTCLQIALTGDEPLDAAIYSLHEQEFDDPDYSLSMAISPSRHSRHVIKMRLNGWTKGLLEVHHNSVHFLHRTVQDFLKGGEMAGFLKEKAPKDFCPELSIIKAYTAWIKTSTFGGMLDMVMDINDSQLRKFSWQVMDEESDPSLEWLLKGFLKTASSLEAVEESQSMPWVEEEVARHIDEVSDAVDSMQYLRASEEAEGSSDASCILRTYILEAGLVSYLNRKLLRQSEYLGILNSPALTILLDAGLCNSIQPAGYVLSKKLFLSLECLLRNGEDPNEAYTSARTADSSTPYRDLMVHAMESKPANADIGPAEISSCALSIIRCRILSLFWKFNAHITLQDCEHMVLLAFQIARSARTPSDEDAYLAELEAFFQYKPQGTLVHDTFLSKMEQTVSEAPGSLNARLLVDVLSKLLQEIQDNEDETCVVWERIEKCLPSRVIKRVQIALGRGGIAGRKRKRDECQHDRID